MNWEKLYDKWYESGYHTEEESLAAIKKDVEALQFVHNQTEKICLVAVKDDGYALQHVKNQTEEMCLIAVEENGNALQYVRNQTEKICIAAVKESRHAVRHVSQDLIDKYVSKMSTVVMLTSSSEYIRELGMKRKDAHDI